MQDYSVFSDKDLVEAIKSNDRKAFDELYARYVEDLVGFIYNKLQDLEESKDLVQEIFVLLWTDRENIVKINSVSNYLYKVAINRSLNVFRQQRVNQKYINSLAHFLEENSVNQEDGQREIQREYELSKALDLLPAKMRTIFELRYYDGLSNEQVAQRLSLSVHTVSTQMKRALKSIRGQMNILVFLALLMNL